MKYILANFKTNMNSNKLNNYFQSMSELFNQKPNLFIKTYFFTNSLYTLFLNNKFSKFNFGNQSFSSFSNGSFTSSVSIQQLKDENVETLILGHSEEYKYFGTSESLTNEKVIAAIDNNFKVFLCFGNEEAIQNVNQLVDYLVTTLKQLLHNVDSTKYNRIVLAYEPIYAIGTGKTMDITFLNESLKELKSKLMNVFGYNFEIVYGGSVDLKNSKEILDQPYVDGILIGKASLNVEDMKEIIKLNGNE